MNKVEVVAKIRELGLIPILRTSTAQEARTMAEALVDGGISNLEIPLTVPDALAVIRDVVARYGGRVLVGAGTVLDGKSAEACVLAGATFILSPGLNVETITTCRRLETAIFPGALTPTEILTAWQAGADAVKVFPCSAVGGASYIRAVKAPLPQIDLVPTGGVSVETAPAFIQAGAAALGVGSDLVDLAALREGRTSAIADRAQAYLRAVKQARSA